MSLFQLLDNGEIEEIREKEFKLEKELQYICEKNLKILLGLQLVKSEFVIENYRFDTLAYDEENKSEITCENCGKEGSLKRKGWIKCLCKECETVDNYVEWYV